MITRDPFARALRLAEIEELLKSTAPPEDTVLLLAFSRAFYAAMPDSIALDGDATRTAERLTQHFNFFVHELPDVHQAGPGVPGLHVRVRNLGVTAPPGKPVRDVVSQRLRILEQLR